jgi:hypothetical protein
MNRRNFLKGVGAGLVAAALPAVTLALPAPSDRDRLNALLKDGAFIYGQSFVFDDGLPVDLRSFQNVSLVGCTFHWTTPTKYYVCAGNDSFTRIEHCSFRGVYAEAGIRVEGPAIIEKRAAEMARAEQRRNRQPQLELGHV